MKKTLVQKICDVDEWIRSLTEAQAITADIAGKRITHDQSDVNSKEVRPFQMGEFLRKYVSRRLLALSDGEIAALTTTMRQLGVGSQGGAEALAIFHQLSFDESTSGTLDTPLARQTLYEVGQRSLERPCPGFTEDSLEQAALSAGQSGLARPAHLKALIAAKPWVLNMIRGATTAGLLPGQLLLALLDTPTETATAAFLDALDNSEKPSSRQ